MRSADENMRKSGELQEPLNRRKQELIFTSVLLSFLNCGCQSLCYRRCVNHDFCELWFGSLQHTQTNRYIHANTETNMHLQKKKKKKKQNSIVEHRVRPYRLARFSNWHCTSESFPHFLMFSFTCRMYLVQTFFSVIYFIDFNYEFSKYLLFLSGFSVTVDCSFDINDILRCSSISKGETRTLENSVIANFAGGK